MLIPRLHGIRSFHVAEKNTTIEPAHIKQNDCDTQFIDSRPTRMNECHVSMHDVMVRMRFGLRFTFDSLDQIGLPKHIMYVWKIQNELESACKPRNGATS